MIGIFRNRKAQNTAEYAIMIAIVIGVFSAMQIYIRRGLQARIKSGVDVIPGQVATEGNVFGTATQYEPYYIREGASSMTSVTQEGTERGAVAEAGGIRELTNATSRRTGYQTITGAQED